MPIICLEGASAAGKTTLSEYLCERHGACIVPEVNLLFQRKPSEERFWYFERQVERWEMAVNAAKTREIVIFDGDPFQPLWYNWAYNFDVLEPLETVSRFYQSKLADGKIDFPDKYFILFAERDELRKRKINDFSRTRKNFERHLEFIEPQRAFFDFVKSLDDNLVEFVENEALETTGEKIINSLGGNFARAKKIPSLALFGAIKNWLGAHAAENFKSRKNWRA